LGAGGEGAISTVTPKAEQDEECFRLQGDSMQQNGRPSSRKESRLRRLEGRDSGRVGNGRRDGGGSKTQLQIKESNTYPVPPVAGVVAIGLANIVLHLTVLLQRNLPFQRTDACRILSLESSRLPGKVTRREIWWGRALSRTRHQRMECCGGDIPLSTDHRA